MERKRDTYDGWLARGRQVRRGEKAGRDGKFHERQTQAGIGRRRSKPLASTCCLGELRRREGLVV